MRAPSARRESSDGLRARLGQAADQPPAAARDHEGEQKQSACSGPTEGRDDGHDGETDDRADEWFSPVRTPTALRSTMAGW